MALWDKVAGFFSGGVKDVIKEVGDAADKLVTSDEERLALKNALAQIETNAEAKAQDFQVKLKELEQQEYASVVQDRASARQRDVELTRAGKPNKRQDRLAYLSLVMLAICIVTVIWVGTKFDLNDTGVMAAFSVLNMVTGGVIKIVTDVYGYDFGGSLGSEAKNSTISNVIGMLSRKREGEK